MKNSKKIVITTALLTLITVSPLIASVKSEAAACRLSKSSTTLKAGNTCKIKLNNCKTNVVWSSSNKNVATVNKNGRITAVKKGTATICAKAGTKKYSCKVTVNKKASAVQQLSDTVINNSNCTGTNFGNIGNTVQLPVTNSGSGSITGSCPTTNSGLTTNSCPTIGTGFISNNCIINIQGNNNCNSDANTKPGPNSEPDSNNGSDSNISPDSGTVTESSAYNTLNSLRDTYVEGTTLTNQYYYYSPIFGNGYGCYGFAAKLSDTVFGTTRPYTTHSSFDKIRVGDNIRIGNSHSVIVLTKDNNSITVVEGNYNSSIHWDRKITASSLASSGFTVYTRY